jgi:hypothetical protein
VFVFLLNSKDPHRRTQGQEAARTAGARTLHDEIKRTSLRV